MLKRRNPQSSGESNPRSTLQESRLPEPLALQPRTLHRAIATVLFVIALIGCSTLTWLSHRGLNANELTIPFVALFAGMFVTYLASLRWLRLLNWSEKKTVQLIVGSAILFRLALLPGLPILDDDLYRYRWDGKVAAHGMNPYAYAPEAKELASLQQGDLLFDKIGFRDVPAVYPPASQAVFAIGYAIDPDGIWGVKTLVVLFDIAAIFALMGLLKALGRPLKEAALYAWNPLVLKEFANSGHHDAVGIALFAYGLYALAMNRRTLSAIAFSAATLIKPIILLLTPGLWRRFRGRDWLVWGGLVFLAYLPFAQIGFAKLFAGMRLYTQHWEMNDSLFALIQSAFGGTKPTSDRGFLFETNPAARMAILILWGCVALYLIGDAERERHGSSLLLGPKEGGILRIYWRMTLLLCTVLALTPTMDPWYVCWLVPLLCLFRWEAGVLMTGTVALSYLFYWKDRDFLWLRPLEFLPVIAWGIWEFLRNSARKKQGNIP